MTAKKQTASSGPSTQDKWMKYGTLVAGGIALAKRISDALGNGQNESEVSQVRNAHEAQTRQTVDRIQDDIRDLQGLRTEMQRMSDRLQMLTVGVFGLAFVVVVLAILVLASR